MNWKERSNHFPGPVHFVSYLADITNRDRMAAIFGEHHPELVYHAAAYKHVPMMESNPSESDHVAMC